MRTSRSRARSMTGFEFAMSMRDMKREGEQQAPAAPAQRNAFTDAWVKKALAAAEKRSASRARIKSGG